MIFLYLVLSLDKTIEGINSIFADSVISQQVQGFSLRLLMCTFPLNKYHRKEIFFADLPALEFFYPCCCPGKIQ